MQDRLEAPTEAQQLLHDICEEGGHVYVCGDVSMADRVGRTIQVRKTSCRNCFVTFYSLNSSASERESGERRVG